MSAIDALLNSGGDNTVGNYTFIDADTLRDKKNPNVKYRLQGFDAPEIAGLKGTTGTGADFRSGTAGSDVATSSITSLASKQGFTNLVKTGKFDPNGREIVELHNEKGENFTTKLLQSGVIRSGKYTTQEDVDAIDVANLWEEQNEGNDAFAQAAKLVSDASLPSV